mmetsp:Transcript_41783/g.98094  ORF Transcript_41783/g.98094 Transcript_41783/m.98094 type:complete len:245 (-) Transcript_41783:572-1306(-)
MSGGADPRRSPRAPASERLLLRGDELPSTERRRNMETIVEAADSATAETRGRTFLEEEACSLLLCHADTPSTLSVLLQGPCPLPLPFEPRLFLELTRLLRPLRPRRGATSRETGGSTDTSVLSASRSLSLSWRCWASAAAFFCRRLDFSERSSTKSALHLASCARASVTTTVRARDPSAAGETPRSCCSRPSTPRSATNCCNNSHTSCRLWGSTLSRGLWRRSTSGSASIARASEIACRSLRVK